MKTDDGGLVKGDVETTPTLPSEFAGFPTASWCLLESWAELFKEYDLTRHGDNIRCSKRYTCERCYGRRDRGRVNLERHRGATFNELGAIFHRDVVDILIFGLGLGLGGVIGDRNTVVKFKIRCLVCHRYNICGTLKAVMCGLVSFDQGV